MKDWLAFEKWLEHRLTLPLPGFEAQRKMMNADRPHFDPAPESARKSAVLLLLYPQARDVKIVLIQRTEDRSVHSGQIAFPGGKKEDFDLSIEATALRETWEEVNLNPKVVKVLGRLTPLYIPVSHFEVFPIVGVCGKYPKLLPCDAEVAGILRFSFREIFLNKQSVDIAATGRPGMIIHTPAYIPQTQRIIWGATAMILSELESIWYEFELSGNGSERISLSQKI